EIHTVLTDNGTQFCDLPSRRNGPTARLRLHMFDRVCFGNGIEHRLTKPNHPWTNGQVERMNRTSRMPPSNASTTTTTISCYEIHPVLTDHGTQFCDLPSRRNGPTARLRLHMFDRVCFGNGIEHRLTKPNHPWTNGQVERMNRTSRMPPSNASTTTTTISCDEI